MTENFKSISLLIMARIIESSMRIYFMWLNDKQLNHAQHCIRTFVNLSFKVIENSTAASHSPPLLILHDLLSNKKQWDSLGKIIQTMTKRPVVTVDQRNHGHSPHASSHKLEETAADVTQLLKKLSIDRAYFLGHGLGGKTTMLTALLAPQIVAGLIVLDVSPISSSKQFNDFFLNAMTSMKKISFKGENKLNKAKEKAKKQLKNTISDDVTMNIVLSNIILKPDLTIGWACNLDVLIKYFKNMTSFPSKFKGKTFYGPTLFIGGQLSEYLPPDDLPAIRHLFPSAVITYVSKAGHNLQNDDPKSFLELIIPFLK